MWFTSMISSKKTCEREIGIRQSFYNYQRSDNVQAHVFFNLAEVMIYHKRSDNKDAFNCLSAAWMYVADMFLIFQRDCIAISRVLLSTWI